MVTEPDELELPAAPDPLRTALLPMIEHIFAVTTDGSPERNAALSVALAAVERIRAALAPRARMH